MSHFRDSETEHAHACTQSLSLVAAFLVFSDLSFVVMARVGPTASAGGQARKRGRDSVDLSKCTLATLPTNTLTVESENDVLFRLLELLPEGYTSSSVSEQRIPRELIVNIMFAARSIILSEPMVPQLESPLYVCGDIHGQYYDLLNIFHRCPPLGGKVLGKHSTTNGGVGGERKEAEASSVVRKEDAQYGFLFLGDYVDRGARSVEVIVTLLALKIISPPSITMLRGNHEDEQIMLLYGFFDECKRRYDVKLFKLFADLFRVLPVAALVNGTIFCMHGGISADLHKIEEIPDPRPCNIPHSGVLCDLLWADPESDLPPGVDWAPSSRRISFVFSDRVLEDFLQANGLDLVVRAHQVVEEGYQFFPNSRKRLLLTVFSATNYCNEFGNRGGVLVISEEGVCSILTMEPPDFTQQRNILLFRDPLPNPKGMQ